MSIIRIHKTHNYSIISNVVLNDERLSWRARGIAAYLLSKPDDWRINAAHLHRVGREGRDAVRAALKELEDLGYLRRLKEQGEGGKWSSYLVLYEEPQDAEPTPGKPTPGNPTVGKPGVLLNTEDQVLISMPDKQKQKGSREGGEGKKTPPRRDEWVDLLVPMLYGHSNFDMVTKTHWSHVQSTKKTLLTGGASPAALSEWFEGTWRKEWPGKTGQRPLPTQVVAGVAAHLERKAPAPAAQYVAVEEEEGG